MCLSDGAWANPDISNIFRLLAVGCKIYTKINQMPESWISLFLVNSRLIRKKLVVPVILYTNWLQKALTNILISRTNPSYCSFADLFFFPLNLFMSEIVSGSNFILTKSKGAMLKW